MKHGTEEGEGAEGLIGSHAFGAGGTAEEAKEDGFRLVVGVVAEEDFVVAGLGRAVEEKLVASLAGGGFEGEFFLLREGWDVDFLGNEAGAEEIFEEGFVGIGFGAAEGVVEVDVGEVLEVGMGEPVVEENGVGPARDREKVRMIRKEPGGERGHGFRKIMRCCQGRS